MKFVKVIIDGKEYYRMVSEEDEASGAETVDCDIEDCEPEIKKSIDAAEFFERVKTGAGELGSKIASGAKDLGEKISAGAKDIGGKISVSAKDLGSKISSGAKDLGERLFGKDKTLDYNSKEARLLRLLPFMSKDETHALFEELMKDGAKRISKSSNLSNISTPPYRLHTQPCLTLPNPS